LRPAVGLLGDSWAGDAGPYAGWIAWAIASSQGYRGLAKLSSASLVSVSWVVALRWWAPEVSPVLNLNMELAKTVVSQ